MNISKIDEKHIHQFVDTFDVSKVQAVADGPTPAATHDFQVVHAIRQDLEDGHSPQTIADSAGIPANIVEHVQSTFAHRPLMEGRRHE